MKLIPILVRPSRELPGLVVLTRQPTCAVDSTITAGIVAGFTFETWINK